MGNRAKRRRLPELTTGAKIGIGVAVLVVVVVAGVFAVTSYLADQVNKSEESVEDFASKSTTERKKEAKSSAIEAIEGGNTEKAGNIYDNAIEAETDPTKKVQLAIDHSRMLMYSEKYDEAIAIAKEAEGYSEDKYLATDWLGRLYASAKRYNEAAAYFTKAGGLVDSPTNVGKYNKDYYERRAADMKALAEKK